MLDHRITNTDFPTSWDLKKILSPSLLPSHRLDSYFILTSQKETKFHMLCVLTLKILKSLDNYATYQKYLLCIKNQIKIKMEKYTM